MSAKPPFKPQNLSTVSPYLCVKGAGKAIEFYRDVFGAKEIFRMNRGDKVGHAELAFGESIVMVADEFPEVGFLAPKEGSQAVQLVSYVPDAYAAGKEAAEP